MTGTALGTINRDKQDIVHLLKRESNAGRPLSKIIMKQNGKDVKD